jgi:hypothetical protein
MDLLQLLDLSGYMSGQYPFAGAEMEDSASK